MRLYSTLPLREGRDLRSKFRGGVMARRRKVDPVRRRVHKRPLAKLLRANATAAERILWSVLRRKQLATLRFKSPPTTKSEPASWNPRVIACFVFGMLKSSGIAIRWRKPSIVPAPRRTPPQKISATLRFFDPPSRGGLLETPQMSTGAPHPSDAATAFSMTTGGVSPRQMERMRPSLPTSISTGRPRIPPYAMASFASPITTG